MRAIVPLIAVTLAIAGCGYKTPLVLPRSEAQRPASSPVASPGGKKAPDEPAKE